MACREGGAHKAGDASQKRACLLLSLIFLVWNLVATVTKTLSDGVPAPAGTASVSLRISPDSHAIPGSDCAAAALPAPPTARQKFLVGHRVDINRATAREISGLPGISDSVAASIVAARKRLGGFRAPEDLLLARGIKMKRLKKILPFLSEFPNN